MPRFTPNGDVLNRTLERVLASDAFARSERARRLLRYLVEQEQAGKAGRLKGFAIAVDVFGKDAEFDPSTDAQVRVQAGRLRDLLDQYFDNEGADEPIRISIPRGSYAPAYSPNVVGFPDADMPQDAAPDAARLPEARRRRRRVTSYVVRQVRMFWAALSVVIVLLGFVAYNSYRTDFLGPTQANAATATRLGDAVVSLPKVFLKTTPQAETQRVATVLRTALSGFDTVVFTTREIPKPGDAAPLDYNFDIHPGSDDGSVEIALEHIQDGAVIASKVLSRTDLQPAELDDRIADLITASIPTSGTLYGHIEAASLQRGLTRCLLLNDNYYLDQRIETHRAAYDCFQQLHAAGAYSPLIFSEMAALTMEAVTDKYAYPIDASGEQALELARKAVQMAPTSPYAHRAYGFAFTQTGNKQEALKWSKKAYDLDHFDLSMAAAYGYSLVMAGKYSEAAPVLSRAINVSSARPSWWDYSFFLAEYMLDKREDAANATDALTTAERVHYLAACLIAARIRAKTEDQQRLVEEIRTNYKSFAADPRAAFTELNYPADMVDKLVDGLIDAGLNSGS